ncbi:MAG: ribosome-associated translation inhibitor RaiA [Propionibacteriaceae bacterium]|jgi:ribosomal subunit interface protein|nr:ribosome-associated translation inhibitor RaiA [Propionibacteriaceae bacterium]
MDVTITGRRIQVTDSFREQVARKMAELDSRVDKVIRAEVQAQAETRGSGEAVRVEITLIGKGPVVRAEALADDKSQAFDEAFDHLKIRLKKAQDRRRTHRNLRKVGFVEPAIEVPVVPAPVAEAVPVKKVGGLEIHGDGPMVVREKLFWSAPLTLAQALDEMELVGHDFFLYVDADTSLPSVVYRRKAYDYGVIHLKLTTAA